MLLYSPLGSGYMLGFYDSLRSTKTFYRFQGGNSYPYFNIIGDNCRVSNSANYTYFSKSINHHKYFIAKRLTQLVGDIVLEKTDIPYTKARLYSHDEYKRIQKCIAESEKLDDLESLRFIVSDTFYELLDSNFQYNDGKEKGSRIIERVDRKIYGGGYGISDEWLKLFNLLTIMYGRQTITKNDVLTMLKNIRMGYKTRVESISFLKLSECPYIFNKDIFSDFIKYQIIDALEEILDKGLYNEESEFGRNPKVKIKQITGRYMYLRDKVLRSID